MKFKAYIQNKLAGIVDLIWEQEMPVPGRYTVLPSGKVELLFPVCPIESLDAVRIAPRDNPVNNHSCFLSGLHTRPLKMTFERFHAFGVQMRPVAVKALFGIPLFKIRDYFVEGDAILDTIRMLEDRLYSRDGFMEKAKWLESYLLKKMNETADLHIAINLDQAIGRYHTRKHKPSSKTMENLMGYSRTQTYRLFNDWFGISAHSYQKLVQFIRSVETLHNRDVKLIDAGLDNGYYDQSHFVHTFQDFAGMTPGEYRRQMSPFPGQIFG